MKKSFVAALALGLTLSLPAFADGDAAKGATLYKAKCMMCHAPDQNKIGPKSNGAYGRKAGSLPDYTYSPALKATNITWDDAQLDKWLTNPSAMVPGTKMAFKVDAPQDRADIIAHLKTLK